MMFKSYVKNCGLQLNILNIVAHISTISTMNVVNQTELQGQSESMWLQKLNNNNVNLDLRFPSSFQVFTSVDGK